MAKTPRVNKTKEEIAQQLKHVEKVEREKVTVKLMYPLVVNQKSIYDAQTALSALAGFIKNELNKKTSEIVLHQLGIDLSKEKDSEIKTSIIKLIELLKLEKAKDTADLLERFSNALAQLSAQEYMKNPMSNITINQIVAS